MNELTTIINNAEDINVLYVEDDVDARDETSGILGIFFKNIYIAKNGQEGIECFNNNKIDLVISDISMPIMNGLEMIRNLRLQNKNFKSIFITALSSKDILLDSIELNIDGYIIKPIEQTQFETTISKIINIIHSEKIKENFEKELQIELQRQKEIIQKQSNSIIEMLQKDSMTGLYNFEKLKVDYHDLAVKPMLMLFNIDNFNFINLTHSYTIGDKVIEKVALFLNTFSKKGITIYKLYGDEFMLVLENMKINDTLALAERVQSELNTQEYLIENEKFNLNASIAILECLGEDEELPYHKVKLALQEGRNNHKNSITLYKENMLLLEKQQELLKWAKKTKDAIDNNLLKAFYQPIYEFEKEKITKYESLARIVEGDEVISPFYFLSSAKAVGLMPTLTKSMITQAFHFFKDYKNLSFSVNITDEDLKDGELFKLLLSLCAENEIEPSRVALEILESINDYNISDANKKLEELRNAGFLIALDDFGAESSNFTRLQNLNVDIIKIDGLFIKNLDTDINSRHIVQTMVYLAKKTNKKTIAEFVHSKEIFDIVRELGIDFAQGYFVGQPLQEII